MVRQRTVYTLLVVCLLSACGGKQATPAAKTDGVFESWQVVTTSSNGGNNLCYTFAAPSKADEGFTGKRAAPYLMATRRPSGKIEVSVSTGFLPKQGSDVEITLRRQTFPLASKGAVAWALDDSDDKNILKLLQAPGVARVSAVDAQGQAVLDTYSTKGFKDALDRVKELCP